MLDAGPKARNVAPKLTVLGFLLILPVFPLSKLPPGFGIPISGYIATFCLFCGFSLFSPTGKIGQYPHRLRNFLHDVRIEMKQVNWPSRADVWSTTMVVIVTVAFFALYFFVTDSLLSRAEDWLFHFVKR